MTPNLVYAIVSTWTPDGKQDIECYHSHEAMLEKLAVKQRVYPERGYRSETAFIMD